MTPASRKEAAPRNEYHSPVARAATSNPDAIHEITYDNCQTYVHSNPTVNLDEEASSFIPKKLEARFYPQTNPLRNPFPPISALAFPCFQEITHRPSIPVLPCPTREPLATASPFP